MRLVQEALEIEGWLFPNLQGRTEREGRADELADLLQSSGFKHKEIRVLTSSIRRGKSGAPATKRRTAIEALELRASDRGKWSWTRMAMKLCLHETKEREAPGHFTACAQQIRQAVISLQKLMRKCSL
jgi:hypothetical protein